MPTTPRSMALVHHHATTCFYQKSPMRRRRRWLDAVQPPADLIWHVISRSGVVISITNCYIRFTFTLLNDNKTEFMCAQRAVVNLACPMLVLPSALLVRLQPLRLVTLASTLTRTCQCVVTSGEPCRAVLPRSIQRQVPTAVFQSLVTALVLPHLDYCNSVLYGLPTSLIQRLQSVQNGTARLIFGLQRSEHISPAFIGCASLSGLHTAP